jgi:hypothetical protein
MRRAIEVALARKEQLHVHAVGDGTYTRWEMARPRPSSP